MHTEKKTGNQTRIKTERDQVHSFRTRKVKQKFMLKQTDGIIREKERKKYTQMLALQFPR